MFLVQTKSALLKKHEKLYENTVKKTNSNIVQYYSKLKIHFLF